MPKSDLKSQHAAAELMAVASGQSVQHLRQQLIEAEEKHAAALAEATRLYGEANAEEILALADAAEVNQKRHDNECRKHCDHIQKRRGERKHRGGQRCAHDQVKVFTVDGETHTVVSAHELLVKPHGFGTEPRDGSRYRAACDMTVDAPHDELDHDRFDQSKTASCTRCADVVAKMDAGEIPNKRSDYLSAAEHLAHVRKETRRRNRGESA